MKVGGYGTGTTAKRMGWTGTGSIVSLGFLGTASWPIFRNRRRSGHSLATEAEDGLLENCLGAFSAGHLAVRRFLDDGLGSISVTSPNGN